VIVRDFLAHVRLSKTFLFRHVRWLHRASMARRLCGANERALGPSWPYLIETGFTTRPSPSALLRTRFPPLKTRSGVNFRLSFCAASSEVLIDCSTELNASCQGGESGSEPSTLPVYKVILIINKS
jgi:hypothetical protein